ncbi:hypothetical protein J2Z49_000504 [Desulfofundulus luciae]|uniref:Small, acid-soluble spore protein, alpha/beta type n=1 Tax=Desulfofundulus luciae TaxID=74702 RepID=A0ABU0AY46_9FIRM|nr:hypothetical protein [Desulfofundulus luciae]MDQ0285403.1 hypothetical protein [Desulfofundulus luciae]
MKKKARETPKLPPSIRRQFFGGREKLELLQQDMEKAAREIGIRPLGRAFHGNAAKA